MRLDAAGIVAQVLATVLVALMLAVRLATLRDRWLTVILGVTVLSTLADLGMLLGMMAISTDDLPAWAGWAQMAVGTLLASTFAVVVLDGLDHDKS